MQVTDQLFLPAGNIHVPVVFNLQVTCISCFLPAGNNVKLATEGGAIREVCNVLKIHIDSSQVAEAACASVLALSLDGDSFIITINV